MNDVRVEGDATTDVERVYREHGARLWRSVYAFAGDREVASDAVAEAFTQAMARGEAIDSILPWVWRATFRIAAGELKSRRRHEPLVEAGTYDLPEPAAEVIAALAKLSPKQRAAVVLHEYAGHPVANVAQILGSTSGAVRVHLSVGRKRLRELLGEDR